MLNKILNTLLKAANEGYENGELDLHIDLGRGNRGDGLADFIAAEIREVIPGQHDFESARQVSINAMETAVRQLQEIIEKLSSVQPPAEIDQQSVPLDS